MIPKAPILEPEQIETWADKQDYTHIAVLNDTEISREAQRDADSDYCEAKLEQVRLEVLEKIEAKYGGTSPSGTYIFITESEWQALKEGGQ